MKSRHSDDTLLAALARAEATQTHEDLEAALCDALRHGSFTVVMRAAEIADASEAGRVLPDLEAAFERLLALAASKDPGCLAKLAVAKAMRTIGNAGHELLLRGARHIQLEPVWGKPVDTAGNLRGICVTALVEGSYPDAIFDAVRLLADPTPEARRHAVQAVAAAGRVESELLLRMKALHGDEDDSIVADAVAALVRINPERSLDFAAGFLESPSAVIREETALALGESHLPEAFPILRDAWEAAGGLRAPSELLLAIALHRSEEAFAFLMDIVGSAHPSRALEALGALSIFRHDSARWEKVEAVVRRRRDSKLVARLNEIG
jgi:HEAT repeat protein